jgi:7,8-dihydropterin-6-yl-methyl-4-(beta-D-ribofuranosyl)aminobenzene 5'-phosphate synthase
VIVDSASDLFFKPAEVAGVKTEPGRSSNSLRPLHSEWGLSLYLEPQRGDLKRTLLLDFGWTPEVINGNMELLKVDPSKVDALIMSHGHWDHLGGMMGFLDRHRKSMPADLSIYAGGEDNFCQRYFRAGQTGSWDSVLRSMRPRLRAFDHGSISTPGFIMPFGSSSRLAPRSARANSSGRCLS